MASWPGLHSMWSPFPGEFKGDPNAERLAVFTLCARVMEQAKETGCQWTGQVMTTRWLDPLEASVALSEAAAQAQDWRPGDWVILVDAETICKCPDGQVVRHVP